MLTLPILPYDYAALEPVIDETTMRIHHLKHQQAYLDKLKAALEKYPTLAEQSVEDLLKNLTAVPEAVRTTINNHGGGYFNHSLFWTLLTPVGSAANHCPAELQALIEKNFGGWENFQAQFKTEGLNRFGSGWVWLVKTAGGGLKIISTANQDSPLTKDLTPLFGVDLWEHAYYLKYQNRRGDYLDAFWSVANWERVAILAQIGRKEL